MEEHLGRDSDRWILGLPYSLRELPRSLYIQSLLVEQVLFDSLLFFAIGHQVEVLAVEALDGRLDAFLRKFLAVFDNRVPVDGHHAHLPPVSPQPLLESLLQSHYPGSSLPHAIDEDQRGESLLEEGAEHRTRSSADAELMAYCCGERE